jgi:hypothetical protein
MNFSGLTEDEKLLINSGLSMIGGVVVGAGQAEYQYLTTNGHITFGGALSFALATFVILIGNALRVYIPAHAQQMISDAEARATQLEEALHLATSAQPVIATTPPQAPGIASQSPVTIHINGVPLANTLTATVPTLASMTQSVNSATPLLAQPATAMSDIGPIAATPEPDISGEDTAIRPAVKK